MDFATLIMLFFLVESEGEAKLKFTTYVKCVLAHTKVIILRELSNKNLIGNGPNKVAIKDAFHSFIYLLYHLVNLVKEIADFAQIDI